MTAPADAEQTRYSAMYDTTTIEAMRDIAWWERRTLTSLAREAFGDLLVKYHSQSLKLVDAETGKTISKSPGEPYPSRQTDLKRGRPME